MKKRLFGLCFVLVLLCAALAVSALADGAAPPPIPTEGDVWDGVTITQPSKLTQVDGVNFYEISTCAELAYIAQTGGEWWSRNYILTNDLILNDVVLEWDEDGNLKNDLDSLHLWTPIGKNYSNMFTGIFDGGGHTISGLVVIQDGDYAGLFGYANRSSIKNLGVTNAHVSGKNYVGGIVGYFGAGTTIIESCCFSGVVTGVGIVGGIAGNHEYGSITNCCNTGTVTGESYVGGITGAGHATNCYNTGTVTGESRVGGITGNAGSTNCYNTGTVTGESQVGGIGGYGGNATNCYNRGSVTGDELVGGIVGKGYDRGVTIKNCYNIGPVTGTEATSTGAIVGSDGAVWSKDTITGCYYLNTLELYGCGNVAASGATEPEGFYARTAAQLKQQSTYKGWAFETTYNDRGAVNEEQVWAISADTNDGYPHFFWKDLVDHPISGFTLSSDTLTLGLGETAVLSVSPVPDTGILPVLTWKSNSSSIASVNGKGEVTANTKRTGTAVITVSGGDYSATCTITVQKSATETPKDEYSIGSLTLTSSDGAALSSIPKGTSFWVTIPVKKLNVGGNTLILLATYTAEGQFLGNLMCVQVDELPEGGTVKVSLLMDNAAGNIGKIKAIPVASFGNFTSVGAASEFSGD